MGAVSHDTKRKSCAHGRARVTDETELERRRTELRNCWRIAEDTGLPTPKHVQVHELIMVEMKFRADFKLSMAVAHLVAEWIETRNPYAIDQAVVLCGDAGIEPPRTLWAEIANVARQRFAGEERGGTPSRIEKSAAHEMALALMLNLRDAGASVEVAASKAARWLSDNLPSHVVVRASTLERRYSEEWLVRSAPNKPTREATRFKQWKDTKTKEVRDIWTAALHTMPDASGKLKGNRRR